MTIYTMQPKEKYFIERPFKLITKDIARDFYFFNTKGNNGNGKKEITKKSNFFIDLEEQIVGI